MKTDLKIVILVKIEGEDAIVLVSIRMKEIIEAEVQATVVAEVQITIVRIEVEV